MTIDQAIAESREREKKARDAGCLPADNCVFNGATWKCVFCGRESGKAPDMWDKKWEAVDDARTMEPKFREALAIAVKAIEREIDIEPKDSMKHVDLNETLAAIKALF